MNARCHQVSEKPKELASGIEIITSKVLQELLDPGLQFARRVPHQHGLRLFHLA